MFQTEFVNYLRRALADHELGVMPYFANGLVWPGGEIVALRANMEAKIRG